MRVVDQLPFNWGSEEDTKSMIFVSARAPLVFACVLNYRITSNFYGIVSNI